MENKTTIELDAGEALLFIAYQKRHAFFQMLEGISAFDIKNGSLTVNFDSKGAISSVQVNHTYRP